jgi:cobalamin biosynthesis protein CobT
MKTNLQASKSILAKLLASENITVSHQSVKTAYFDLKNRTMVLPVWKDMDGDLYDLLTGHEVGHALNTPQQGWHNEVAATEKKFKDFLNVIEDARIEKLVKRKFPGLSKSFARAYASLYERDFFGIKKLEDLSKLNLIDRINLRFKMGSHVIVEFNDIEREIVREVEAAETWDQVVDIARRVYDYTKQNEQNKVQNQQDLQEQMRNERQENQEDSGEYDDAEDDSDYEDDIDGNDDSDLDEESDGTDAEDSQDQIESDEEDSDDNQYSSGGDTPEEDDDEPQSVTDRSFRQREQELVNETGKIFMYELPDAVLENIILPNTEVVNDLEKYFREQVADPNRTYGRYGISYDTVVQKCVRKFNTNNKKVIMHILKEFEMRKKANEYARTQTARTGELNMNVLHKYRFSNDLFKKITVVPKGKNHGFIMFVDMSGSMSDILRNTIEQMLVLASFCKLAKVPFEVYGFSDDAYGNKKLHEMMSKNRFVSNRAVDMTMSHTWFHLKHLIGSSLSPVQYRRAFNAMCVIANEYGRAYDYTSNENDHGGWRYDWDTSGFGLNGTPFLETLLASRGIITAFQNKHQLNVCNVVYLTDGDGGSNLSYPLMSNDSGFYDDRRKSVVYFIDKKTKKKVKLSNYHTMQPAITELVADVTGCKHIGFYVGNKKAIQRDVKYLVSDKSSIEQDVAKKTFREHNYFVVDRLGYDKYFYVGLPSTNIVDDKLAITSDMNKNKMAREFSKNVGSKKSNRLLLTKLAEELAVA